MFAKIRQTALTQVTETERVFWIGSHSIDVAFYFRNLPEWILKECSGDEKIIREEIRTSLALLEYEILLSLGIATAEDQQRTEVAFLQLEKRAKNSFEDAR